MPDQTGFSPTSCMHSWGEAHDREEGLSVVRLLFPLPLPLSQLTGADPHAEHCTLHAAHSPWACSGQA